MRTPITRPLIPRRAALATLAGAALGSILIPRPASAAAVGSPGPAGPLTISLAQWSLHRTIRSGKLDPLDFARVTRQTYALDAVEYVNQFFMDKAGDADYLAQLKQRADDHDIKSLLIMCDGIGALGHPDDARRAAAVDGHKPWVLAAKTLGCHSIRVNAETPGSADRDEKSRLAADGLRQLAEFGAQHDINIIVENHGGLSSDGAWLAATIRRAEHPRVGTLPDFGNFSLSHNPPRQYDRYQGVQELMPFAKAVSAKSYDFDDEGNETTIDYRRMLQIVHDSGYQGCIGIEYEGARLPEHDGILATKALLQREIARLSEEPG